MSNDTAPTQTPPAPCSVTSEETPPATGCPERSEDAPRLLADPVVQHLKRLEELFEDKIRYDRGREEIIDRLHAGLEDAKADLVWKILRPVLLDLVMLHDELARAAGQGPLDIGQGAAVLAAFRQDVEDILFRQGVEQFVSDGDRFDPRRQRASRTIPASQPDLANTIAERLAPGFATPERLLRPELVAVYSVAPARVSPAGGDGS